MLPLPRAGQKQPTVIEIQKIEEGKYRLIAVFRLVLKNKTMFDKLENRLKICMKEKDELISDWEKKEFTITTSDYELFKEELKVDNIPYKEIS